VYPNLGSVGERPFLPRGRMEPLVFALLAALTPPDVNLCFFDDRIEAVPKSMGWKLRARVGDRKKWYQDVGELAPPEAG